MRAAIHNPYLDTLGGGERYTVTFAKVLAEEGHKVDIEWKDEKIKEKLETRFGLNLGEINFIQDIKRGDGYDLCFWLSDGSIPLLRSRKNILHFQFPFKGVGGKSLINKMKLLRVNKVICNSNFTKSFIDKEYQAQSVVIYPPVDVKSIKPRRKENVILFVGRFSQLTQSKNQHILMQAFKSFYKAGFDDWKLVLTGGSEIGAGEYIDQLKKSVKDYSVEIIENPKFNELKKLYGSARIFWSAVGFGEDEDRDPKKVEHFGITVVEAMAAGAVPIIFKAGGYKEIIKDSENGFLWKTKHELVSWTKYLIRNNKIMNRISKSAIKSSREFSYEKFKKKILEIITK